MKKLICGLLAALLLLSLMAGCKKEDASATQPAPTTSPTEAGGLEDSVFDDNQPQSPTQNTQATQPDQPQSTTPATGGTDSPVTGNPDSNTVSLDYETFKAMTGAQKKAYQESFETIDAFFEWYNAALKAYQEANPPTEVDSSGNITLP